MEEPLHSWINFSFLSCQERRFAVLISSLLSSQTKDNVTHGKTFTIVSSFLIENDLYVASISWFSYMELVCLELFRQQSWLWKNEWEKSIRHSKSCIHISLMLLILAFLIEILLGVQEQYSVSFKMVSLLQKPLIKQMKQPLRIWFTRYISQNPTEKRL